MRKKNTETDTELALNLNIVKQPQSHRATYHARQFASIDQMRAYFKMYVFI